MTIYEVRCNVKDFQYFLPADPEVAGSTQLIFDCDRRGSSWKVPELYIYKPKLRRGNFLGVNFGFPPCFDQHVYELDTADGLLGMSEVIGRGNELIPFQHEGETFHIINVLECINALDRDKTIYSPENTAKIGIPDRYVFHKTRIPETPLFKIPETSRVSILCAENAHDPAWEFKRNYEQLGLTGLKFKKLWSDEDS